MIDTAQGRLRGRTVQEVSEGDTVLVGIRPEHITLQRRPPVDTVNAFEGIITSALFEGAYFKYRMAAGDTTFLVHDPEAYAVGDPIWAVIDPDRIVVLRDMPDT